MAWCSWVGFNPGSLVFGRALKSVHNTLLLVQAGVGAVTSCLCSSWLFPVKPHSRGCVARARAIPRSAAAGLRPDHLWLLPRGAGCSLHRVELPTALTHRCSTVPCCWPLAGGPLAAHCCCHTWSCLAVVVLQHHVSLHHVSTARAVPCARSCPCNGRSTPRLIYRATSLDICCCRCVKVVWPQSR
jgi:hypothetical protein